MRANKIYKLSSQRGFTLLEMIVVIAIIATLGAIVGPNMIDKLKGADKQATVTQVEALVKALEIYDVQNRGMPSTEQGLQALVTKPSGFSESIVWSQQMKEIPVDKWGNPYQYLNPGSRGDFDVYSYGPDGRKSDDDIGNW